MMTTLEIEELQRASDYRSSRKGLVGRAIGSIIFGLIAVFVGIGSMEDSSLNLVLAGIGGLLFIEGVWLAISRHPKGLVVDGIALIILGIWNIGVYVINIAAAGQVGVPIWLMVGGYQIYWGSESFGRYRRFSGVSAQKPNQERLKQVDEIAKAVTKANPKDSSDIIQFQTSATAGGGFSGRAWKGRLSADTGVFATIGGDEVLFLPRDQVRITGEGKARPGKPMKAAIHMGRWDSKGTITPEWLERYEAWKRAA